MAFSVAMGRQFYSENSRLVDQSASLAGRFCDSEPGRISSVAGLPVLR
jgi:hypothetical protein